MRHIPAIKSHITGREWVSAGYQSIDKLTLLAIDAQNQPAESTTLLADCLLAHVRDGYMGNGVCVGAQPICRLLATHQPARYDTNKPDDCRH